MPPAEQCRQGGLAGAHEWVKHHISGKGVQLDQPARQFHRERRRVPDFAGRLGRKLPDAFAVFQEFLAGDGGWPGGRVGAFEGIFGKDQDIFVRVAQRRVGGRHPTAPGGGWAGAGGFIPDDLAAHQETQRQHILQDVRVQRDVRLAPQVGDVDAGPAARGQDAAHLAPDAAQKGQVLVQAEVFVIGLADVIGRRGDHQVDAAVRQVGHLFRRGAKNLVQAFRRQQVFDVFDSLLLRLIVIQAAGVERRRVVADSPRRTEGAGGGFLHRRGGAAFGHRLSHPP